MRQKRTQVTLGEKCFMIHKRSYDTNAHKVSWDFICAHIRKPITGYMRSKCALPFRNKDCVTGFVFFILLLSEQRRLLGLWLLLGLGLGLGLGFWWWPAVVVEIGFGE